MTIFNVILYGALSELSIGILQRNYEYEDGEKMYAFTIAFLIGEFTIEIFQNN